MNKAKELLREINTVNLEALADWLDVKYKDDPTPQVQVDLRKWADNIRQALAALECQTCDWIPVSERLPEKTGCYAVTDGEIWWQTCWKDKKIEPNGWWQQHSRTITHWKPIVLHDEPCQPKPDACSDCLRYNKCDFDEHPHMRCKNYMPKPELNVHPESYCHKCGGKNITWHTDNDLWNRVVEEESPQILCPICFTEMAKEKGVPASWQLLVDEVLREPKPEQSDVAEYPFQIHQRAKTKDELLESILCYFPELRAKSKPEPSGEFVKEIKAMMKEYRIKCGYPSEVGNYVCSFDIQKLIDHIEQLEADKRSLRLDVKLWKNRTKEAANAVEDFESLQAENKQLTARIKEFESKRKGG